MFKTYIFASLLVGVALGWFTSAHGAEPVRRDIHVVMCDTQAEMKVVWELHTEDGQMELDKLLLIVKSRVGTDNCMETRAEVEVEEKMEDLHSEDYGALELDRVLVYRTCGGGACLYFPTPTKAFVILRAEGVPS